MTASKYVDTSAIINTIGCIYNNNELLDNEQYVFREEDFPNTFHAIMFEAILNLHLLGVEKVGQKEILDYLEQRPEKYELYKRNNGEEWLKEVSAHARISSFDYYYNRVKKFTLLRQFEDLGLNLRSIYDPDNVLDVKLKQAQEDFLDNHKIEEIGSLITRRIDDVILRYVDNDISEAEDLGSDIFEVLESLDGNPDVGMPLYDELFNTVIMGARLGKLVIRSAKSNEGKAIVNSTKIPTPQGWKTVGDIKVGDELFGKNGKPTKVLAVYPQREKKQVYRVSFKDDRYIDCCEDHLWTINKTTWADKYRWETISTKDMLEDAKKAVNGFGGQTTTYRYTIPLNQPVQYPEKQYSIDPYVMGLAIGDGSFRYEDKYIPKDYLIGSEKQRWALLRGLMNTNESVTTFTTISIQLKDDVIELCNSLGIDVEITTDKQPNTKNICYNLHIQTNKAQKEKMFRLEIVNIEPLDRYEDMTCFTVDSPDSLFLVGDYITTHNTRVMVADMLSLCASEVYNPQTRQWDVNPNPQSVLYITIEQTKKEIQTMALAFLSGVNENAILKNKCTPEERERVNHAAEVLNKKGAKFYCQEIPDFSIDDIVNAIKHSIREANTRYIGFDYLSTSVSMLAELNKKTGMGLREDQALFMLTAKLKDICQQEQVFILTSTQVNRSVNEGEHMDASVLRGSYAIADRADAGMIMDSVAKADLENLSPILGAFGEDVPDGKIVVYKNRANNLKNVIIWCKKNLGVCRLDGLFITDKDYNYMDVERLKIKVKSAKPNVEETQSIIEEETKYRF